MVCKVGHPTIHKIIRYWPSYEIGNQHELEKIGRQDFNKHRRTGTHDAMDTDLLGAFFSDDKFHWYNRDDIAEEFTVCNRTSKVLRAVIMQ